MEDETGAINIHADQREFTLAEVVQLEVLHKKTTENPITLELCEEISAKFNSSPSRSESRRIASEQVQSWLQDKRTGSIASIPQSSATNKTAKSKAELIASIPEFSATNRTAKSKAELIKRAKAPTISASEAAVQLPNLIFEARSAKDGAWFDVASFLGYRILDSGELVVRVRFAGFGKEEDEWVSVKKAVRERSVPLSPSECRRINVGDLVLCFREFDHHALYCDAHIVEIERKSHESNQCTCIFMVHYEQDNFEEKVPMHKVCYRPTKVSSAGCIESKVMPEMLDPFVG